MKLAIVKCPEHGFYAVTIDSERHGVRITPGKCCGRWVYEREWRLTAREWRDMATEAECAADEVEASE